jgi:coenzyme F420-reducing hydrogenase delta subunit/formate hydrogenlyase subunit 6/NADH:ubiquinone oxidoreductase subunit I
MTEHLENVQTEVSVRIDGNQCSRCMVCPSVCPFDAISTDEKNAEVKLDIEKCQVCGICFSACPASAIETVYYDVGSLTGYVDKSMHEKGLDSLLLTCRGAGPLQKGITSELEKLHNDNFISISLPCVGRVPPELLLKALSLGIKKIVITPCQDEYCRFKDGSKIGTRRILLTRALLSQLGFKSNTLTVIKRLAKAHVDSYRCIGCGDCKYTCPYDAIKIEVPGVARIDLDACSGCGACAAVCPVLAIRLDGSEYEAIHELIRSYSSLIPDMRSKAGRPVILVLCCQWSEFSNLDMPQSAITENIVFVGLPCASRADTLHIIEALDLGFDGVLIAACERGGCKLEEGNEKAEQRTYSLKKLLSQVNLENRLEICFVSPKTIGQLNKNIKSFVEKISSQSERR